MPQHHCQRTPPLRASALYVHENRSKGKTAAEGLYLRGVTIRTSPLSPVNAAKTMTNQRQIKDKDLQSEFPGRENLDFDQHLQRPISAPNIYEKTGIHLMNMG